LGSGLWWDLHKGKRVVETLLTLPESLVEKGENGEGEGQTERLVYGCQSTGKEPSTNSKNGQHFRRGGERRIWRGYSWDHFALGGGYLHGLK